jgi:hypothetical protein
MRTKTVFQTQELAHIWARQSQSEGRNPAGNVYFHGKKIYSYGSHFCMANIVKPGIVLINANNYSNTTAKHLGAVRYAVNHMVTIQVDKPEGTLIENLRGFQYDIKVELDKINNTRTRQQTKEHARNSLVSIIGRVERYLDVTEQSLTKKLHNTQDENARKEFILYFEAAKSDQAKEELQTKLAKQAKAIERAEKRKNAKFIKEAKAELLLWRAGRPNKWRHYNHLNIFPVMLRTHAVENTEGSLIDIETSKGARVTYKAGKILFDAIQAGKDVKGMDIDGYTVISLNGVLKVGCHEIDRKEINRFAKKEGWLK